ncbi:MAG: TPM domain-containing protein [Bacteroidetes bacterium]|nr:TPM domain-containing protein [Bacteroidota bacterium]
MNTNLFAAKKFLLFLFLVLTLQTQTAFSKQDRVYAPEDLPVPVFDSTGFIIDPDHRIIEEWYREIIGTRETYFFCRYIEPVCVRVDNIRDPDDANAYADKLVELWNLEERTNGRFVFQLHCKSKQTVVFKIGSRLKSFYKASYLRDLANETAEVHLTGQANGTGDFVSFQKLGDHIFKEIAFDTKLSTYEGNTGIHSIYPDKVEKTGGDLEIMSESHYADNDPIFTTSGTNESVTDSYGEKNYFTGLTQEEINLNFYNINRDAAIADIKAVPNERELNGKAVTDPHTILTEDARQMINALLKDLEDSLGYQVAVVCLNSIGDNDPHLWGTDLFNLWGIGDRKTDNGLLMLLVVDQHAIEFITGRGTEGILTDVDCYNIQQYEMVPYFKSNDYVTGMIRGTQATCDFFYGAPPVYEAYNDYSSETSDYTLTTESDDREFNLWKSNLFIGYLISISIFTAAWMVVLLFSFFVPDLHKRYHILKFFSLTIWIFLFPVPFALLYFVTKGLMNRWRNTVRFSKRNGEEMHKLGDLDEDKHLSKGQVSEEKVKSIDYDVWVSYGGSEVLILSYKKWFSKHAKCPSCSFKTYYKLYDKTITAATYTSSGTGERCYKCENCGHIKTERYTIPRKTRSSSSSGGSSGGYSRSYGSSGGSSYGGGSSRGGGAGSRW